MRDGIRKGLQLLVRRLQLRGAFGHPLFERFEGLVKLFGHDLERGGQLAHLIARADVDLGQLLRGDGPLGGRHARALGVQDHAGDRRGQCLDGGGEPCDQHIAHGTAHQQDRHRHRDDVAGQQLDGLGGAIPRQRQTQRQRGAGGFHRPGHEGLVVRIRSDRHGLQPDGVAGPRERRRGGAAHIDQLHMVLPIGGKNGRYHAAPGGRFFQEGLIEHAAENEHADHRRCFNATRRGGRWCGDAQVLDDGFAKGFAGRALDRDPHLHHHDVVRREIKVVGDLFRQRQALGHVNRRRGRLPVPPVGQLNPAALLLPGGSQHGLAAVPHHHAGLVRRHVVRQFAVQVHRHAGETGRQQNQLQTVQRSDLVETQCEVQGLAGRLIALERQAIQNRQVAEVFFVARGVQRHRHLGFTCVLQPIPEELQLPRKPRKCVRLPLVIDQVRRQTGVQRGHHQQKRRERQKQFVFDAGEFHHQGGALPSPRSINHYHYRAG